MWAMEQEKKVEVSNAERKRENKRDRGRKRMEVDGETLNHW